MILWTTSKGKGLCNGYWECIPRSENWWESVHQGRTRIVPTPRPPSYHIQGTIWIIRSSGLEFTQLLAACLKELDFFSSKCEPEIFMRQNGDHWKYIATYVDDLCIVMEDSKAFLEILTSEPYNFKLKGLLALSFHLGCEFERDINGILCTDLLSEYSQLPKDVTRYLQKATW